MYTYSRLSQQFCLIDLKFLEVATKYKKPKDISVVHYIYCSCLDCHNENKTSNIEECRDI
jgi:hypothetical protein